MTSVYKWEVLKLLAQKRTYLGLGAAMLVFFFQAEDGIRDLTVTGVQTCALPISDDLPVRSARGTGRSSARASRRHYRRSEALVRPTRRSGPPW